MKVTYDGSAYRIEPLTSDQDAALRAFLDTRGFEGITKGGELQATQLRLSAQNRYTALSSE